MLMPHAFVKRIPLSGLRFKDDGIYLSTILLFYFSHSFIYPLRRCRVRNIGFEWIKMTTIVHLVLCLFSYTRSEVGWLIIIQFYVFSIYLVGIRRTRTLDIEVEKTR
jgi:hypothetical protein